MLVIEFMNHIELLLRITGKVLYVKKAGEMTSCTLFKEECIDALEVLSCLATHNQREEPSPQRKQP